jgi:hypothetical protein
LAAQECVSCDSCGEGSFITNGCPTYVPNKNNCTTCTSSCDEGGYMSRNCTGTKMYDDSKCTLCASCAVGEYISSQCPAGISFNDIRTCAPCSDCSNFSNTLTQGQSAKTLEQERTYRLRVAERTVAAIFGVQHAKLVLLGNTSVNHAMEQRPQMRRNVLHVSHVLRTSTLLDATGLGSVQVTAHVKTVHYVHPFTNARQYVMVQVLRYWKDVSPVLHVGRECIRLEVVI